MARGKITVSTATQMIKVVDKARTAFETTVLARKDEDLADGARGR